MKQFIFTTTAALAFFIIGCAPSDQGKQFTNQQSASTTSNGSIPETAQVEICPFKDINFNRKQAYDSELIEKFNKTLKKHTNTEGLISYFNWRKNKRDLASLCNMMSGISNANISAMDTNTKKAFLINAHNIFSLSIPLYNYEKLLDFNSRPLRSIKNINGLGQDIFSVLEFKVAGQSMTLENIEKKLLAPMADSRVIFSLSCAALGCPQVLPQLLSSENLDTQLNLITKNYINNRNIISIDFYGEGEGGELLIPSYLMSKEFYLKLDPNPSLKSPIQIIVNFLDQKQLDEEGFNFKKEDLLSNNDELWFIDENTFNWTVNEAL